MQVQNNQAQKFQFNAQPQTQKPKYRSSNNNIPRNNNNSKFLTDEQNLEELQGITLTVDELTKPEEIIQDYYRDQAPEPIYKPIPKGINASTQVVDTELFDYDLEIDPILQTIVGKTLEQSRNELIEEYDIKLFQEQRVRLIIRHYFQKNVMQSFQSPKDLKTLKLEEMKRFKEEISKFRRSPNSRLTTIKNCSQEGSPNKTFKT